MKRTRCSEEQIVGVLKLAEAGQTVAEICRRQGISEATFSRWKAQYGGLEVSELRRLRQLEDENLSIVAREWFSVTPDDAGVTPHTGCGVVTARTWPARSPSA